MEFLLGVLESITANILTGTFLYIIFRYVNPRYHMLAEFKKNKEWFSAWVVYGDNPDEWVTEILDITIPLMSRSLNITSRPIKSNAGTPIRQGDKSTPLYHWQASCSFTPDNSAISGHWHSILQPAKYKGEISLDIKRLSLLEGECSAPSSAGDKKWRGPIIISNDIEIMRSSLRKIINDDCRVDKMINNLEALKVKMSV